MLASGQAMYLLVPSATNKPVLEPGKVVESASGSFAIQLQEKHELALGMETLAYCEVRGKFFQQGATLTEIHIDQPEAVLVFNRVGEPVSAEQRQTFRVAIALAEVVAQLGDRKKCQVVDCSAEGMAIIASPGFSLGVTVKVVLVHEDYHLAADARVQTIKVLPTGKVRYGLLVPNTNAAARKTLLKMSMGFQRTQLKRLAGAA